MSVMKSFKGKLADGEQEEISLSTNNGLTGYEITKFQVMPTDANIDVESVVKIYSVQETTVTDQIDFSESTLLAASIIRAGSGVAQPLTVTTIFDNIKFNQDVFVTLKNSSYTAEINYYIEMKQSDLSLDEQTVATLKNIRNSN
jgi:hypothetical protein